jgi:hypothetical protein
MNTAARANQEPQWRQPKTRHHQLQIPPAATRTAKPSPSCPFGRPCRCARCSFARRLAHARPHSQTKSCALPLFRAPGWEAPRRCCRKKRAHARLAWPFDPAPLDCRELRRTRVQAPMSESRMVARRAILGPLKHRGFHDASLIPGRSGTPASLRGM